MSWTEILIGGLVGALLGALAEASTSFVRGLWLMFKYRSVHGDYEHENGVVQVRRTFGNRFVTDGREVDSENDWTGSFSFQDLYMHVATGAYRHIRRQDDWGFHSIRRLENGDLSVQWENLSGGKRDAGAVLWKLRS